MMIKFLVDESVGEKVAQFIRSEGFDTFSVMDGMRGASDVDIIRKAIAEDRIVVTNDRDFGELVFRFRFLPKGVLLLRLKDECAKNKVKIITSIIREHLDQLTGNFLIVTEKHIRKRSIVK